MRPPGARQVRPVFVEDPPGVVPQGPAGLPGTGDDLDGASGGVALGGSEPEEGVVPARGRTSGRLAPASVCVPLVPVMCATRAEGSGEPYGVDGAERIPRISYAGSDRRPTCRAELPRHRRAEGLTEHSGAAGGQGLLLVAVRKESP
ncbi:hypothetical protein GCM10010275_56190 [Streptomyces litmocidini]|nr:hypothetical protein GCM10010275_56190 [Streptomyces litmocidini]